VDWLRKKETKITAQKIGDQTVLLCMAATPKLYSKEEAKERYNNVREVYEQFKNTLHDKPYVKAIGVGMKQTGGQYTPEPAIVLFVDKKYTEDELKAMGREILPKVVVSDKYGEIPIDIEIL